MSSDNKNLLSRRSFMGAAANTVGIAGLGAMGLLNGMGLRSAHAQSSPSGPVKRFIFAVTNSGCIPSYYWPTSSTRFNYSTEPLERHAANVSILRGINMPHRGDHRPFVVATGSGDRDGLVADHPSIDQLLIDRMRQDGYDRPALVVCGQSKSGKPQGHISFDLNGNRVNPQRDPIQAFEGVFGRPPNADAGDAAAVEEAMIRASMADLEALYPRLGTKERQALDLHSEALDRRLTALLEDGAAGPSAGEARLVTPPRNFLERLMYHAEVIALSFAADRRRVASLLVTPMGHDNMGLSSYRGVVYEEGLLPGLTMMDAAGSVGGNLHQTIAHGWSGNASFSETFARIHRAETAAIAYMVDRLKATPDPVNGGSVFDHTVIYVSNEHGGPNHGVNAGRSQFPTILIAGSQTGIKVGQYVELDGANNFHGRILLSIAQAIGAPLARFGDYTMPWNEILV